MDIKTKQEEVKKILKKDRDNISIDYNGVCYFKIFKSTEDEIAKQICFLFEKEPEPEAYGEPKICPYNTEITCHKAVCENCDYKPKSDENEATKLREALIADTNDLWRVTNAIKKEIESREWILEGRGCYQWNDARYRDETRWAFEAVLKLIEGVQHPAQKRFHEVIKLPKPKSIVTEARIKTFDEDKIRTKTLKEAGEWLENEIYKAEFSLPIEEMTILYGIVELLQKGELPVNGYN